MKGGIGLLWLLLCCTAQAAGERLISDFDGTLLKTDLPAGVWDAVDVWPGSIQSLTAAAATRGLKGLRIDDQVNTTGQGDSTAVYVTFPGNTLSQAQLRFWFRVTSTSQAGSVVIAQTLSDAANARSLCDVSLLFPDALVTLGGDSRLGNFTATDSGVRLPSGKPVLIECMLRGLGTDAGERSLYIDSTFAARELVDFGGLHLNEVTIGEPFSEDRRFVGQLDFDDVRVADRMQASRLVLDAGSATVDPGACVPVGLAITDSEGTLAGLPYAADFSASLANGALYLDAMCSTPIGNVPFAAEQTTGVFFLLTGSGPQLTFGVSFPDLVGAGLVLPIRPPDAGVDAGSADAGNTDAGSTDAGSTDAGSTDAGSTDAGNTDGGAGGGTQSSDFKVGCNCDSGSGAPLLLFGLAALTFSGPRRRIR